MAATKAHGPALLLRALPFMAICAAGVVAGLWQGAVLIAVIAAVGLVGFVVEVVRRWHPPAT